ncbi:hypothetical protein ACFYRN_22525 [Streptomyces sp. NPDC005227]|uniref:hypothetical protein n=1 Tax=Streptomyces sp. NPDC005227 TaxID=3364707 RepID=UPI003675B490
MTSPAFRPTHVVPQDGLSAWETPDTSRPTVPLDALLPVQLVDRLGDWGRVVCANGWSAWVDGRLLIGVPQVPPDATGPPARTADPRPLLARVEEALTEYRRVAEELAAGQVDGEAFRARTQGRRIGVVVDGESMWLYDGAHERWVFCDGARLSTFAAERAPSTSPPQPPARAREPQRPEPARGPVGDRQPPRNKTPEREREQERERKGEREWEQNQGQEPERERERAAGEEPGRRRDAGRETEVVGREPEREQDREREPVADGERAAGGEPGRRRDAGRETEVVGREPEGEQDREREPVADVEREQRGVREREEEETRAVPDAAPGGHEPTRVVTFDDDRGRP